MGKFLRAHRAAVGRLGTPEADRDAGMTLIELMFAMVIFAIVAAGAVAGLTGALTTTRSDRNRVAASDLAARELEIVRNTFTGSSSGPATISANLQVVDGNPLPGGTAGQPLVVDNTPYTVTRNVEWLPAGSGQSPCDGGAGVTYPSLEVQVVVTWPQMSGVAPVVSTTILTPPKNTLNSSTGFVAVKVLDATGARSSGQTVTLTGPGGTYTDTTASDGCAVFASSTAGTYAATLNQSNYVDNYGNQTATKNVALTAGSLSQLSFNYDRAAKLNVTMQTTAGYALPQAWPQITLGNTGLQPLGFKYVSGVTSATTTITGLWPYLSDGYTSWAGGCTQADPAASGGARGTATIVAAGATGSATVTLAPVTVTVTKSLLPVPGVTVTATPVNTATCPSTENPLTLGVTNSLGILATSLPAGAWVIKVSGKSPVSSWPTTPVLLPTSLPTAVAVATT
jgi:prepilin-type N-terminal cleavage/methylation domain-containing protein